MTWLLGALRADGPYPAARHRIGTTGLVGPASSLAGCARPKPASTGLILSSAPGGGRERGQSELLYF
jgi:hypothetical protein